MNITDEYRHLIMTVEAAATSVRGLPLALNEAGRLVFPDGERPSLVDLAFEAIRRGFRGEKAENLMHEWARRDWIFAEAERVNQDAKQQGRDVEQEEDVMAMYSWKDIPGAAIEVVEAAGDPELLEEWRASCAQTDAELKKKFSGEAPADLSVGK